MYIHSRPLRVRQMGKRIYLLDDKNCLVAELSSDEVFDERLGRAVAIAKAVEAYEIAETLFEELTAEEPRHGGLHEALDEFKAAWREAHETK